MRRLFDRRRPRVLAPLLVALRGAQQLSLEIVVSGWLERESPRVAALLRRNRLAFRYVRRGDVIAGRAPSLRGIDAVIAAAESSHPAHTAGHALAERARSLGLGTYALQHGFEQVGLYGADAAAAEFASDTVFCWFPPAETPADLPAATRAKLVHVGRPAPAGGWSRPGAATFDLGVFENLHWDRYADADRTRFGEGLLAVARRLPGARILLRPHPAAGWSDALGHQLAPFENITRAGALQARRRLEGGAEILRDVSRVITTPSTVALDAALMGLPVALAVDGGAAYRPLPVMEDGEAWVAFALGAAYDPGILDQFCSRVLVAGDGAPRIVERLGQDLARTVATSS